MSRHGGSDQAGKVAATPRLIRLTRAIDPATTPLQLRKAWVLTLPSPPAKETMARAQRLLKTLANDATCGAEPLKHLKAIRRLDLPPVPEAHEADTDSDATRAEGGGRTQLDVVLAYQTHEGPLATLESTVAFVERLGFGDLLQSSPPAQHPNVDEHASQGSTLAVKRGSLRLHHVPTTHIPTRARTEEWNAHWPCVLRTTAPPASLAPASLTSSSANIDIVDRAADARMWADEARLRWAQAGFQECVELARTARARGDLPIAAYVTAAYEETVATRSGAKGANGLPRTLSFLPVLAQDTRVSTNHPLRHAVLNAIRRVADERKALRFQQPDATHSATDALAAKESELATTDEGGAVPTSSSSSAVENGQDYLLTSLSLFTTHEPCTFCMMALVHSRVRQLCFVLPSPGSGACCGNRAGQLSDASTRDDPSQGPLEGGHGGGPFALHEQQGLNHHFEVWRWNGPLSELGVAESTHETSRAAEGEASVLIILDELSVSGIDP